MQLRALGEQLMPFSPSAAVACFDAAQGEDEQKQGAPPGRGLGPSARGTSAAAVAAANRGGSGSGSGSREDGGGSADGLRIAWSACSTYRVTQPSRRLRIQVERWAAVAAAGRHQQTITGAAAGHSSSSVPAAAVATTTHEREPIAELHRGPPLDAWLHTQVMAAAAAGTHDGSGGAPLSPPSTRSETDARHGDGTYGTDGTDAFGDGGSREPDEDADDGFGVFSDADPWDARAPWHPWAVQTDPVAVLELDVAWEDLQVPLQLSQSGGQQQQQQQQGLPVLRLDSSSRWLLHALQVG
ncbi:hypothetical protein Vafri_17326, partial [Volvox africanus]